MEMYGIFKFGKSTKNQWKILEQSMITSAFFRAKFITKTDQTGRFFQPVPAVGPIGQGAGSAIDLAQEAGRWWMVDGESPGRSLWLMVDITIHIIYG